MNGLFGDGVQVALDPMLPLWAIAVLAAVCAVLVGFGLWHRARGSGWRTAALILGLLALLDPALVSETRRYAKDIALVVVDDSPSQALVDRPAQTEAAVKALQEAGTRLPDLDLRIVRAGRTNSDGTALTGALDQAMEDVPRQRFAGAILLTDGQVHDTPTDLSALPGPIHTLLTGAPGEGDRRLVILSSPSFALVDKPALFSFRVEEPAGGDATVPVTIQLDGADTRALNVPANEDVAVEIAPRHGGQSVVEIATPPGPRELTLQNNRAALTVNGIRDRLRVLLISGEPHPGERTWRNLLKADPSVDLVHFTILRPADRVMDMTPVNELSLIAFPIRELFEVKLNEFDLIIFDRYRRRNSLIPATYLQAVANYVERGGAVLEVAAPAFATNQGLFASPIGTILPGQPTGKLLEGPFRPEVTSLGWRHPVTQGLDGAGFPQTGAPPSWGRWFRAVDVTAGRGQVVMTGPDASPLVILDRVGEGRVAQILSDQLWLWSRGYDGGGPQAELLRRLAHWLMKEPTLEEEDLVAAVRGDALHITRRSLTPMPPGQSRAVTLTDPDGRTRTVTLTERDGVATGTAALAGPGVYRLAEGTLQRVIAVGTVNPKEMSDVRATMAVLQPVAAATSGSIQWLRDGMPDLRRIEPGRTTSGRGWIGLPERRDYDVTGLTRLPLLPAWLMLLLAGGALGMAWWREGR
ncbi:MAG: hypothetical protein ACOVKO_05200 [Elstera sp.]